MINVGSLSKIVYQRRHCKHGAETYEYRWCGVVVPSREDFVDPLTDGIQLQFDGAQGLSIISHRIVKLRGGVCLRNSMNLMRIPRLIFNGPLRIVVGHADRRDHTRHHV